MEYAQLLDLTTNVIFPIGVCVYLLWEKKNVQEKSDQILDNLSKNILENTIILKQIFDKLNKGE